MKIEFEITPKIKKVLDKINYLHYDQKRKYTEEPYINHLIDTANILNDYYSDEDLICAALLHDSVEDCEYTISQLKSEFGFNISKLVEYCTSPYVLNNIPKENLPIRKIRKDYENSHYSNGSVYSQAIKIADSISNSKDLLDKDPIFAKVYFIEKYDMLSKFKGNTHLKDKLLQIISGV